MASTPMEENKRIFTEKHPKQPHTRKGQIRLQFEQMIFDKRWKQARPLIARLPDYYGPTANQASYLGSTLEAVAAGKMAFFIGNMDVPREYVYLPDAATTDPLRLSGEKYERWIGQIPAISFEEGIAATIHQLKR